MPVQVFPLGAGYEMPFPGLSQEHLRGALNELQQALFNHEQWHENLNRTLICSLAPDERDLDRDSHHKCRFGQWLYTKGSDRIGLHPSFSQIVVAHELMHRYATTLLRTSSAGRSISLDDYERFVTTLKQMHLEILNTKHELEDAIFNLDPLTGAASRIGMLTKLREQQTLAERKVHCTSIAMMDLDHFKDVNDTYGHAAGDEVLVRLTHYVMSHLRPYDSFYRCGGEEFLLCAPDADLEQGRAMVERLREGLAEIEFKGQCDTPFTVTVSIGLTLIDPDVPVEQSIERADKALYAAKAKGRNRTKVWDASLS